MKKLKRSFVLTVLLSLCFGSKGQEWIQTFGGEYADRGAAIIASPDGSVLVAIETQSLDFGSHPGGDIYLARFDQEGNTIWKDTLEVPHNGYGHVQTVIPTQDSGFLIMSSDIEILSNTSVYLIKFDKYGYLKWEKEYTGIADNGLLARSIIESSEHDYFISGAQVNTDSSELMLMKIDQQGDLKWSKTFEIPNTPYEQSIIETMDGNLMIGFSEGGTIATLLKVTKNGTELWSKVVADSFRILKIKETPDGEFLLAGYNLANSMNANFRVTKTSSVGEVIWTYIDSNPDFDDWATDILITIDGNYLVAGCQSENIGSFTKGWLLKINPLGNLIWQSFLGESIPKRFIYNSMTELPNGGIAATGTFWVDGLIANEETFIISLDSLGTISYNVIKGKVFSDNSNCVFDLTEIGMNDWIVTLNPGNYGHVTTNPNGDFLYTLFDGNYEVTLIAPNPYWSVCENNFQVDFTDTLNFDTAILDFAVNAIIECPYLTIDLTTPFLRRCFPSIYHAHYCNSGTISADSAYVQIVLDTFLSFTGNSSIPLASQSGDTLTFLLGEVAVSECGDFTFEVEVSCDAELGQTHCTAAHIFPDSLCIPPVNWSGAQIEVNGACQNDTIYFNIQNVGDAPTSQPLDFIVIEDDVILMQGNIGILNPQEAEQYYYPATGVTYRMEAEQEPHVPGGWSNPSSTVEACGSGNFSFGFVNQFPQDDASPFEDIDCRENVGSYDPNDKQAFPSGYGEEHFIYPNTDIEYLIRFQNTGTDTAFRVVIRDTLSAFLDPATVRIGASSHPYEFGLSGPGVLKFTFDDILLPDSNVNEAASHGFVKFRVSQKPFLPIGSVIENSAAIYFDFNAPVITNTTWHTVGEDALNFIVPNSGNPGLETVVSPNPFSQKATIEWKGTNWPGGNTFFLFDATGRQVFAKKFNGSKLELDGSGLQSGIYFYSVEVQGTGTFVGKLAVWK